jgi:hypothetical protein
LHYTLRAFMLVFALESGFNRCFFAFFVAVGDAEDDL